MGGPPRSLGFHVLTVIVVALACVVIGAWALAILIERATGVPL